LVGGLIGGVTSICASVLQPVLGAYAGSLYSGPLANFISGGIARAASMAIAEGTGAAIRYAQGTRDSSSILTSMWKGAIQGLIVSSMAASSQFMNSLPSLNQQLGSSSSLQSIGGIGKTLSTYESYARLIYSIGAAANYPGPGALVSFLSIGSGILNVSFSWVPTALSSYGGYAFGAGAMVGLNEFTGFDINKSVIMQLDLPGYFNGFINKIQDDAKGS
jgi:hypothetical protein